MAKARTINLTVGWTFILLGIAGLIFPILQGVLFLMVGLLFLSREYIWAKKLFLWIKKTILKFFPKANGIFESAERFLESEVRKMAAQKNYFRKRVLLLIGAVLLLGIIGFGLAELFRWIRHMLFGRHHL